jgi:hypothetical protein
MIMKPWKAPHALDHKHVNKFIQSVQGIAPIGVYLSIFWLIIN